MKYEPYQVLGMVKEAVNKKQHDLDIKQNLKLDLALVLLPDADTLEHYHADLARACPHEEPWTSPHMRLRATIKGIPMLAVVDDESDCIRVLPVVTTPMSPRTESEVPSKEPRP